jgi:hypothetical protein
MSDGALCNDDFSGATPLHMRNPMEEAANRYWRASRIWRDKQESDWTFGDMIHELSDLQRYRGIVPALAQGLLDSVIRADTQPRFITPTEFQSFIEGA